MVKVVYEKDYEINEKKRLDTSLLKKKGNSHTCSGLMLSYMQKARKEQNWELAELFQELHKQCYQIEVKAVVKLEKWKGKSSFEVIKKPDLFIVKTFQKEDQDSEPKEIFREISKNEVNQVIQILSNLGEKVKTRYIAERFYGEKWKDVFSDRQKHTNLNLILRILDYYGYIEYRGGITQKQGKFDSIQVLLNN